jgi:hypothetical protein
MMFFMTADHATVDRIDDACRAEYSGYAPR